MKTKLIGALLAALLFVPIAASAALLQYSILFGANASDADGGTGTFYWNDSTHLISNVSWDFGGGNSGGIDDAQVNWSASVFGGTLSEFFFEILTQQDVGPAACSTAATGCGQTIQPTQVFGYPGTHFSFSDAVNTNAQTYQIGFTNLSGSFSTQLVGPVVQVPVPGTLALIAIAACGLGFGARKTRKL